MGSDPLSAIVGPDGTARTDSGRLVLAPSTPEELESVVTSAAANAREIHLVEASASPLGRISPASTVPGLSLSRLKRILEVDAANRVVRVEAGVSHESLAKALENEGLRWPIEPFGGHESVAATVVTGFALVRSAGLSDLRHWLLGSRWLLGGGTFLGSGGKTIKNSAGYDITRALVGSLGYISIPVEFQLRVEALPERRMTAIADVRPGLVEATLRKPRGIESIHMSAMGSTDASALISIAGREADVDSAIDGLREFGIRWSEQGDGKQVSFDSLSTGDQRRAVKWTAGSVACARILVQVSKDLPGHAAFATPLSRWGIARGPDQERIEEVISENGGKTSTWPPKNAESDGHRIAGFDEFRRAFDPDSILV